MATKYTECSERDVPAGVRFDTPRRHQGQAVEVQYGGFERAEHDSGAPWKRIVERALGGKATYYRAAAEVA